MSGYSISGACGMWPCGVQPLMPNQAVDAGDIFNTPWWNRPTADNPTGGTGGGAPPTWPASGWNGDGYGYPDLSSPSGWTGSFPGIWNLPADPTDPTDGGTVTTPTGGTINIRSHRLHIYRLEVYDDSNQRLAGIDQWFDGTMRLGLDEASTLRFSIARSDSSAALMVRPNTIWIRDRWGFLVDTFQIQQTAGRRTGDATYLDVMCQSALAQLGEEPIVLYEGETDDGEALTVAQHVANLLETQVRDNALELGIVSDAIAAESLVFRSQDSTILGTLRRLQSALPKAVAGHFYVDATRHLHWTLEMGPQPERFLGLGQNLKDLNYTTDWSQLINRIYMYGEGEDPATRLKLTDAGEAEEYKEDATSVATYGLAPRVKIDRRIRKPETLAMVGDRILEEFSTPQILIELDALDLAKSDEFPAVEDIYIGSNYRVVDTAQSIDTVVEVVAMEINLANPVPVALELTNAARRLGDLIGDLIDALTQPLDVDGDRYPTMGRNYSDQDARVARKGDTRWSDADDKGQMHDGSEWQDMGGGFTVFKAASLIALESAHPAAEQDICALAVLTDGDDKYAWYEIGEESEVQVWRGRTIWET